jgi:hypothetical protein
LFAVLYTTVLPTLIFQLFQKFTQAFVSCTFVELKMKKNAAIGSLFAATLVAQSHGGFSVPASGVVLGNTLPYPCRMRR